MKKFLLTIILCIAVKISFGQILTDTCIQIFVQQDALVNSLSTAAGNNYGGLEELLASGWTASGNNLITRSLLLFNFNSIPAGAHINSADMNLYYTASFHGNPNQSGTNAAYIRRVVGTWNELLVTWNNQPGTSPSNQVSLATSSSSTQDYTNIDVSNLVEDILASGANYGFMLQLQSETPYRNLIFASRENPNSSLKASMDICYTTYIGIEDYGNQLPITLYPNPADNQLMVDLPASIDFKDVSVQIVNGMGQAVDMSNGIVGAANKMQVDVSNLSAGVYFITVTSNNYAATSKFTKQ